MTRRSLRPVTSTDQMEDPRPPLSDLVNISTWPLGAQVGFPRLPRAVGNDTLVRAVRRHHANTKGARRLLSESKISRSPRGDQTGVPFLPLPKLAAMLVRTVDVHRW